MTQHNARYALKAEDRPEKRITAAEYVEYRETKKAAPRTNKYGAKKIEIDGIIFDSEAEGDRYGTLKLLERAKQVRGVTVKPEYPLRIHGVLVGFYTPDFGYFEAGRNCVDDVKGVVTAEASLRMRVFMACYPELELRIVDGQGRCKKFKQRQFKERRLAS